MRTIKLSSINLLVIFIVIAAGFLWLKPSPGTGQIYPPSLAWHLTNPLTEYAPWTGTRAIISQFPVSAGMCVLDIGCGPGRFSIPLARIVGPDGKIVAVDVQQEMLDLAKKRADDAGIANIEFRKLDMGSGGKMLESKSYDFAFMVTVLGEIPEKNRAAALEEIRGALKGKGKLSITEIGTDPHYLPAAAVRALAAETGFKEYSYQENWISYTILLMGK